MSTSLTAKEARILRHTILRRIWTEDDPPICTSCRRRALPIGSDVELTDPHAEDCEAREAIRIIDRLMGTAVALSSTSEARP